jgi:hypothetical protein
MSVTISVATLQDQQWLKLWSPFQTSYRPADFQALRTVIETGDGVAGCPRLNDTGIHASVELAGREQDARGGSAAACWR